ncbi:MAG: response regulator [Bryobacteraceae bacterium]
MLLARSWRASDEESARLAQLVHDGAAQNAAALRIALAKLAKRIPPILGGEFKEVIHLSDELAANLKLLSSEFNFPVAEIGLAETVRANAARATRISGMDVVCHAEPLTPSADAASSMAAILRRAVNLFSNHAATSRLEIRLEPQGAKAVLSIAAHGCAFQDAARVQEIIEELNERARVAGGSCEYSAPVTGEVCLQVSFPLPLAAIEAPPKQRRKIHVLMADDHPVVRRGLLHILSEQPGIATDEVDSFPKLRAFLARKTPGVLVLDINMPGGNGIEMLGELTRHYPHVPVLVLSVHSEETAGVRAIAAGAKGYLTKDAAPEHLGEAVRRLAAGGRYISSRLTEALATRVQTARADLPPHAQLSERELTVLGLIADGKSTAEIGEVLNISPKTVGTYRGRIYEKLKLRSPAELTRYAIDHRLSTPVTGYRE